MQRDDMIIVSVDDHVVEPPDLFERHLPDRYRDLAPRVVHQDDGTDVWEFHGLRVPNIGLNAVAGRPPEEYGIDPTSFDELREGCFDVEKRVLDMSANGVLGSLNFPSLPGFAGRLFGALEDKDAARILTEAYNDWHIDDWCGHAPERFIPLAVPAIWDPEVTAAEIRRVAKKGCHAITFPGEPGAARPAEPALRSLGSGVAGRVRHRDDRLHAHRVVVEAGRDRARRAHGRDDGPAADEHRAMRGRSRVLADLEEVPGRDGGVLRGRDRMDPVLPRAARSHVSDPPSLDRGGLRGPNRE